MIDHFKYVVLTLILFTIQGCVSGKLSSRYNNLLDEVKKENEANLLATEKQEQDDLFKGIEALEIDRLVKIALVNNPDLTSIKERIKEALEKYPQTITPDDPSIGFGLYPGSMGSSNTEFAYKIDIAQPFPYPKKLFLKGEIALVGAEAERGDFKSARNNLIKQLKMAYFELFFIYRALEMNKEENRILQEFKTIATSRYAAGKGNFQDSLYAEVELARIEHREITLNRMLNVSIERLNTLMGKPTGLYLPPPARLPEIGTIPDKGILKDEVFSHNPQIKAARSKKESAKLSIDLARLKYYPDFTLTASYNKAWMAEDLRPFIGLRLNLPIHFSRLNAKRREAEAKFNQASYRLKSIENQIVYKLEEVYQKLKETFHTEKLFRESLLPSTELSLKAARFGYQEGKNDFLTLITAEKKLIITKLQYERVKVDQRILEAELYMIIGKERT